MKSLRRDPFSPAGRRSLLHWHRFVCIAVYRSRRHRRFGTFSPPIRHTRDTSPAADSVTAEHGTSPSAAGQSVL